MGVRIQSGIRRCKAFTGGEVVWSVQTTNSSRGRMEIDSVTTNNVGCPCGIRSSIWDMGILDGSSRWKSQVEINIPDRYPTLTSQIDIDIPHGCPGSIKYPGWTSNVDMISKMHNKARCQTTVVNHVTGLSEGESLPKTRGVILPAVRSRTSIQRVWIESYIL